MKRTRRDLLKGAGACAGAALFPPALLRASAPAASRLWIDATQPRAPISPLLFGSFIEHLGRAVYGGIYQPGPMGDASGFRRDVAEVIRELGVPIVRYPGGNFVSAYNWLDGVGPVEQRPRVLERAWNSIETNRFGTNEFLAWCRHVGTQPMMAVNLGTGGTDEAAALVEYCNLAGGTRWSDLRRSHGFAKPWNVRHWCLGNEMDGPWQIGHVDAEDYGDKAADAARQIRQVDRGLQLIASGSSLITMPTYLEWDRKVLERCYDEVDGISVHRYLGNAEETGGDSAKFLALPLSFERQIEEVAAVCDVVRGQKRASKRLWLAVDEWNVWYRQTSGDGRKQVAPPLLEERFNLEDALVVGGMLNALMRQAERVRIGCLSQLVNVVAPIFTDERRLLKQTTFYPYAWALRHGRGRTLDIMSEGEAYDVEGIGRTPFIDAVAAHDETRRQVALFLLNRDTTKPRELELRWRTAPQAVVSAETLTGPNLKAGNSFDAPGRVVPRPLAPPRPGSTMTLSLPAQSYSVVVLRI